MIDKVKNIILLPGRELMMDNPDLCPFPIPVLPAIGSDIVLESDGGILEKIKPPYHSYSKPLSYTTAPTAYETSSYFFGKSTFLATRPQ